MRVIDAHIHVLDRSWIPAGVRYAWARQATGRREPMRRIEDVEPQVMVKQSDPTAEITMKAFERAGVEAALIPVVDWTLVAGRNPNDLTIDQLHDRHDQLAIATDGRLRYCAGIDPRHPDARERLAQVVTRPHCAGIKLYPAGGWSMSDQSHWWVFEFAHDHQVPVVIHTSPLGGDPLVTPNSRPSEIAPAMAAFPSVSWVFAHAGFEAWWLEAVDIASGWQSAYLDLSLWQMCAQNDYEEFRKRIRTAVSRVGAHRILFGSDIIRGPGEDEDGNRLIEWIKLFVGLGEPYKGTDRVVSEQDLELMLAGNAELGYMGLLHVKIRKVNEMSKIGITGWGWYIPRYQLDRSAMSSAFRMNSGRGSRSVAAYDEDSMTMAIESARRTMRAESNINNLIFSTTHSPVLDKGNASSMAAVLGLPLEVGAYDLGGSIRSGFGSLKFGLSQAGASLVLLSDLRYGRPGSDDEINGGDGAASFTFGANPAVEVVDILSESSPVMDRWRAEGEIGTQVWDDRWSADQQTALMLQVVRSILEKNSLTEADLDSIVISSASVRSVATLSSQVKASSLHSSEIDQFGFLGAADLGVRLAWTLENAKSGQYILVVLGPDGADAMLLKTTQQLSSAQFGRELVGKVEQVDVPTYLTWRGLVSREAPRRPDPEAPSAPAAARNHDWKFAFIGSECIACGSRQLPPQRVCMSCGAIDRNRACSMSSVRSTVKTFTIDRIAFSLSPPVVVGVIDFDGGGRFRCQLTEVTPDDVAVNDRMEMVYRLISISPNGVRNYFWKARPVRENLK